MTGRFWVAVAAAMTVAAPARAQTMDHPGMARPAPPDRAQSAPDTPPETLRSAPDDVRSAPAADRIWGQAAMAASRAALRRDHGGGTFSQVMLNLAEYQLRDRRDGFRWDGEGWFGGDVDRLAIKSEGAGSIGDRVDEAEVQALYSHAIGPYFNVQAGVRYDIAPNPSRGYAVLGIEGLAPYWFDVEGALFVSAHGDLLARLTGYYDQRLTQRLILQPRGQLDLAAQDMPQNAIGAGISEVELGLRLRYEIVREVAPYVGLAYERKLGDTARLARGGGDDVGGASLVLGVRAWF